jgi:acyl dehydratase
MNAPGAPGAAPADLANRPFEIAIGDTASLSRQLTRMDVKTFAVISGDLNPTHVDDHYARAHGDGKLLAHSMWGGALLSSVLGNELPGPGTQYVSQELRFVKPLVVEDTITATVAVREKRAATSTVILDCRCVNQDGEVVATGVAEVIAPATKIVLPRPT